MSLRYGLRYEDGPHETQIPYFVGDTIYRHVRSLWDGHIM